MIEEEYELPECDGFDADLFYSSLYGPPRHFSTGFEDIDEIICGFHKEGLYLLGARTKEERYALALNFMRHATEKLGKNVLFFPLDILKLAKFKNPIAFLECLFITLDCMETADMIIIDHVRCEGSEEEKAKEYEKSKAVMLKLRSIQNRMKIPILFLTQLNSEEGVRPEMYDLEGPQHFEDESDVVMLLHRPDTDSPEGKHKAELYIAKNFDGETGLVDLYFDCEYSSFKSVE